MHKYGLYRRVVYVCHFRVLCRNGLLGAVPLGDHPNRNFRPKFWPFDGEYLENGKSQRYMSIRA